MVVAAALLAGVLVSSPDPFDHWRVPVAVALGALALWIAVQDLRTLTVPDGGAVAIVLIGGGWRLATGIAEGNEWFWTLVMIALDGVLVGLCFWALREIYFRRRGRDALGFGDVKLAAACAVMLGVTAFAWGLLAASLAALCVALARRLVRHDQGDKIAFGAFLAPSCVLLWVLCEWPVLLSSAFGLPELTGQ